MSKKFGKALILGLTIFGASYAGISKSMITLISDTDERGLHCELESALPESNIMGIALWCTKQIRPANSLLSTEQISLTWPKQEDVKDSVIQKNLIKAIQGGLILENTVISVVAKLEENPRKFSASHAHIAGFVSISAVSAFGNSVEYKYSAEKYLNSFKKTK